MIGTGHPQYFLKVCFNDPSKMASMAMVHKRHFHGRLDEMHESFISSAHLNASNFRLLAG